MLAELRIAKGWRRARVGLLAASLFGVAGCSTLAVPKYAVSADTVIALRALDSKVAVGPFASDGTASITCRLMGPIKTPDGEPFADYLRGALRSELVVADRYDPTAAIKLTGRLHDVTFDSAAGEWRISLSIDSTNRRTIRVDQRYAFTTSFVGEHACIEAAKAGMGAAQQVIHSVVTDPMFRHLTQ